MRKQAIVAVIAAAALSACASIPDATYSYYLPKSSTTFTVSEALSCTHDGQLVVLGSAQPPVTTYSASNKEETLAISQLMGSDSLDQNLSDIDATVALYDDGRLKSINAATTGEGETILKSAITLATTIAAFGVAAEAKHAPPPPPPPSPACGILESWAPDKKAETLTYTTSVSLDALQANEVIALDPDRGKDFVVNDRKLYDQIHGYLPAAIAVVNTRKIRNQPVSYGSPEDVSPKHTFSLHLQHTANVTLDFFFCLHTEGSAAQFKCPDSEWGGRTMLLVPDATPYEVQIPQGRAFGTTKFGIALSEAGAIQSIQYARGSGAAGVMNVAATAITAATPPPSDTEPKAPAIAKPVNASVRPVDAHGK